MQDTAAGKLLLGNRLPTDKFDCGHIQFYKPSTHWPHTTPAAQAVPCLQSVFNATTTRV